MARREDVLFCQIAMSNGLITQQAAEKAIAFCDRKELESGRRPLIGAVFTKHNLMDNEAVKRVYAAVQKRLGTSAVPQLVAGGRAKKGKRGAAAAERRAKPSHPIDPRTLWMGVGGIVAFVAIVGLMVFLVSKPSGDQATAGGPTVAEDGGPGGPSGKGPGSSAGGAGTSGGPAPAPQPVPSRELPEHVKLQLDQTITDALSEKGTNPEMSLETLERVKRQLESQRYPPYPRLEQAISDVRASVAAEGGAAAPEATPPASGPATTPAAPPAAAPTPEPGVRTLEDELLGGGG